MYYCARARVCVCMCVHVCVCVYVSARALGGLHGGHETKQKDRRHNVLLGYQTAMGAVTSKTLSPPPQPPLPPQQAFESAKVPGERYILKAKRSLGNQTEGGGCYWGNIDYIMLP